MCSITHTLFFTYTEVVVHPGPAITFRSTGGIIDIVIFNGDAPSGSPTYPQRIVQQYWSLINGGRPVQQPPYWALGFHLVRSEKQIYKLSLIIG